MRNAHRSELHVIPFLIFRLTSSTVSSMKIAESGSDLLIFAWPCLRPISMWCDRMMGFLYWEIRLDLD